MTNLNEVVGLPKGTPDQVDANSDYLTLRLKGAIILDEQQHLNSVQNLFFNPLNPHDASKHQFASPKNDLTSYT